MRAILAVAVASIAVPACSDAPRASAGLGEASAARGRILYRQNGCVGCHGPDGAGNGPVGETLSPPPRDFRDASTFKDGLDVTAIAAAIAAGAPSGSMPPFDHLTEAERRSLALFIMSLRGEVALRDAWVREPLPNRQEAAVFAVVENRGTTPRAIVGVSTDVAERAELHAMEMRGAMMRMAPIERAEVPAKGMVELGPGGFHVMLFGLKRHPAAGETVALTLTLDDGTIVTASADVRKPEGMR